MGFSQRLEFAVSLASEGVRNPWDLRHVVPWAKSMQVGSTIGLRLPWLPYSVISLLEESLSRSSRVFEYGGGGSTLWLADRVGEVVTVEHDLSWSRIVEDEVKDIPACTVLYRSPDDGYAAYIAAIDEYPDDYFDLVVVDGRERVRCVAAARDKVRPGGLLVLDDSDRARYHEAFQLCEGWEQKTLHGLTPTKPTPGRTTIWRRPAAGWAWT